MHTNVHIWAHSPRLPVTYDSVMKHKTHTVEASGAGKKRGKKERQTRVKRDTEKSWEQMLCNAGNERRGERQNGEAFAHKLVTTTDN